MFKKITTTLPWALLAVFVAVSVTVEPDYCRAYVLKDLRKSAAYTEQLRATVGSTDFLTEVSRGQ
jgi:hypothetical protein